MGKVRTGTATGNIDTIKEIYKDKDNDTIVVIFEKTGKTSWKKWNIGYNYLLELIQKGQGIGEKVLLANNGNSYMIQNPSNQVRTSENEGFEL